MWLKNTTAVEEERKRDSTHTHTHPYHANALKFCTKRRKQADTPDQRRRWAARARKTPQVVHVAALSRALSLIVMGRAHPWYTKTDFITNTDSRGVRSKAQNWTEYIGKHVSYFSVSKKLIHILLLQPLLPKVLFKPVKFISRSSTLRTILNLYLLLLA